MDRLTIALLIALFIFSGSGLASAGFILALFLGAANLDHTTLFALFSLLTYTFYGFFGLVYVFISTLTLIGCGVMYWFDLSLDDMKNKANEAREQALKESGLNTGSTTEVENRMKFLMDYKPNVLWVQFCTKVGLTDARLEKISGYYSTASSIFDRVCDISYGYAVQFRTLTNETPGIKIVYGVYDQLLSYVNAVTAFKAVHKMTRNLQDMQMSMSQNASQSSRTGESSTQSSTNDDDVDDLDEAEVAPPKNAASRQAAKLPDMGDMMKGMNFGDFNQIQKQVEALPKAEREKLEKQSQDMFNAMFGNGGMDMNALMGMMSGMQGTPGMPGNHGGNKKRNGKK